MPGGAYSALSGMRTRLEELDRIAADLANVSTPGYKIERASTLASERPSFSTELDSAVDVLPGPAKTDFRPGTITTTGRDLDVAIEGPGFFAIETANGPRYTRAGAFTRRGDGTLSTPDGEAVIGEGGPITLGKGEVGINEDGTVSSGGVKVGQLQIVNLPERDLIRESGVRFRAIAGAEGVPAEHVTVVPGALEQSNASAVDLMAKLTEVSRGFETMQRGVSTMQNELDGRAITELLRR